MPVTVRLDTPQQQAAIIPDATLFNDGVMTKAQVALLASGAANMAIGGPITNFSVVGSVLFVGVGSVLAQDNANFFWDDVANVLTVSTATVVGTATAATLSVTGTGTIATLNVTNTATAATVAVNGTTATAFESFVNGNTAPVSAASTGRLRYNSTTQTFQVSQNGAAYTDIQTGAEFTLDIGDAIGLSTVGSVLFVGAGNLLAQDNVNFFWDDAANVLTVSTATVTGTATAATVAVNGTTATAFASFVTGDTAAVSAASTGRLRYNSGTQTFQVSQNGAAYTDIQTGAEFTLDIGDAIGSSTVGSVLFVGAGNVLQQDNANFFWDDTTNRLGIGNAAPATTLHVTGTARVSSTLTLDPMTAGSVLFAGASGVVSQDNTNFFWNDGTNVLTIGSGITSPNALTIEAASGMTISVTGSTPPMIQLADQPNFLALAIGNNFDSDDGFGGNGGVISGLRAGPNNLPPINSPFLVYAYYDDGATRLVDIGGGQFGYVESTQIAFWTAAVYNEVADQAIQRMNISNLGGVAIGESAGSAAVSGLLQIIPSATDLTNWGFALYVNGGQLRVNSDSTFGGTTAPNVACDVFLDFATRNSNLALANGANNNATTTNACFIRITGPTAAFNITGFAQPFQGKHLWIYNTTTQTMTINHQNAGSTAANRIITGTAADIAFGGGRMVHLIYSSSDSRWILEENA